MHGTVEKEHSCCCLEAVAKLAWWFLVALSLIAQSESRSGPGYQVLEPATAIGGCGSSRTTGTE